MAPHAGRSFASDGELPELDLLLRKFTTKQNKASIPSTVISPAKHSKIRTHVATTHKVHRFGQKGVTTVDKLLFPFIKPGNQTSGNDYGDGLVKDSSENDASEDDRGPMKRRPRRIRQGVIMDSSCGSEDDYETAAEYLSGLNLDFDEDSSDHDFIVDDKSLDASLEMLDQEDGDRRKTRPKLFKIPPMLLPFEPSNSKPKSERYRPQHKIKEQTNAKDLTEAFTDLHLGQNYRRDGRNKIPEAKRMEIPIIETPKKPQRTKTLSSPKKPQLIPQTPHRLSADAFWSADVVNEWNDEYSPRKAVTSSKLANAKAASPSKNAKKLFEQARNGLAEGFLQDLDRMITNGKIAELTTSTGGVRIVWSKTLQTTAGRAHWKQEKVRSRYLVDDQMEPPKTKHHAHIELAEKIISDNHRLLNVVAHEFCHLATFMVDDVCKNPHGKEFKAWGAKVSRAFAHLDIHVTTKHSYEIDTKYVWTCGSCDRPYGRHSKSIDPTKHRCKCHGVLVQTKPVPRAGAKPNEWRLFVKANMKEVKTMNPKVSQKDVMKILGERWAQKKIAAQNPIELDDDSIVRMTDNMGALLISPELEMIED